MQAIPQSPYKVVSTPPLALPPSARSEDWNAFAGALVPNAVALDLLGVEQAMRLKLLPMVSTGAVTPIAGTNRQYFDRYRPQLEGVLGPVCFCRANAEQLHSTIISLRGPYLLNRAEARTPIGESCRGWSGTNAAACLGVMVALLAVGFLLWPSALLLALALWATLTLAATTFLCTIAALAEFLHRRRTARVWRSQRPHTLKRNLLPRIGLLVPLLDEQDIAGRLVRRHRQSFLRARRAVLHRPQGRP